MSIERNKRIWKLCPPEELRSHFVSNAKVKGELVNRYAILGTGNSGSEDNLEAYIGRPIKISMTLTTTHTTEDQYTFLPVVELDEEAIFFGDDSVRPMEVNKAYLDARRREWTEPRSAEDFSMIFNATHPCAQCGGVRSQRVMSYHINRALNANIFHAIKEFGEQVNNIRFNMGVNRTERSKGQIFDFTPVFELNFPENTIDSKVLTEDDKKRLKELGFFITKENQCYQYIHPCPNTCPD